MYGLKVADQSGFPFPPGARARARLLPPAAPRRRARRRGLRQVASRGGSGHRGGARHSPLQDENLCHRPRRCKVQVFFLSIIIRFNVL